MPSPRKKLPIGIQNFRDIREEGYYYVDKTPFACRLIDEGKYYFLSRPRRFGKSLFVDTLKELFEGNQELFKGLHAGTHWDWSRKHPVIRISFGDGETKSRATLDQRIAEQLRINRERLGLPADDEPDPAISLSRLIRNAESVHSQRVALLVDEYDKPILDNLEAPDIAIGIREGLKDIYSVIKGADPHLQFVLLTGVSKFSKVSLFSGLNNLKDITLDARYSAICGYTENDLDTVFAPELEGLDRKQIRDWYNGYNWLGEAVYNPFDVLLLFDTRNFRPWWYETGTPTFLLKVLRERERFLPELSDLLVDEIILSTFDVGNIPTESLFFQTGYLTLGQPEQLGGKTLYRLRFPNLEVYQSLTGALLHDWTPSHRETTLAQSRLYATLHNHDLKGMGDLLAGFYESIPHQWYTNNPIAHYEGYYASVFYAFFASLGLDLTVEESSNAGRLDMVLRFAGRVLIFEFKLVEETATADGNSALATIRKRNYAERYRIAGLPVSLIGIEFSKTTRRIVAWDVEADEGQ